MEEKNYLRGTIGALIGGLIASIPWILLYVYGGYILSLLGALIGYVSYKFYHWFGGKDGNKTVLIIVVSSLFSITVSTFLISPILLIIKERGYFVFSFLERIYSYDQFISAIIGDYIISLLFTILGISGVISKIKVNVSKENNIEEVNISDMSFDEKVKYVESIYAKYDAFSKEKAVSEIKILNDINAVNKISLLMELEKKGIIVAPLKKSYFDREAINNPEKAKRNRKASIWMPILIILLIAILVCALIIFFEEKSISSDTKTSTDSYEKIEEFNKYELDNFVYELPYSFGVSYEEDNRADYISTSSNDDFNGFSVFKISGDYYFSDDQKKEYKYEFSKRMSAQMDIVKSNDNDYGFELEMYEKNNMNKIYILYTFFDGKDIYMTMYSVNILSTDSEFRETKIKLFELRVKTINSMSYIKNDNKI